MRVTPKSEDEVSGCLMPGVYQATVTSATDTTSKKNNEMIALELDVYHGDEIIKMKDWLLDAMAQKMRHFCATAGLMIAYEQGAVAAADCRNKAVHVRIGIKRDPTGQYPPQNTIQDYVEQTEDNSPEPQGVPAGQQRRAAKAAAENGDDDIPF
jgi:hypothetical protein